MTAFHIDNNHVTKVGVDQLFNAKIAKLNYVSLGGNKMSPDEIEQIKEKYQGVLITNY